MCFGTRTEAAVQKPLPLLFSPLLFLVHFADTPKERAARDAELLCRFQCGEFTAPPCLQRFLEALRQLCARPAKVDASCFRRVDALALSFADALAFCLRDEAQKLKDKIGNELPHQLRMFPRIQQGHIQYHDGETALLADDTPLFQNLSMEEINTPRGKPRKRASAADSLEDKVKKMIRKDIAAGNF